MSAGDGGAVTRPELIQPFLRYLVGVAWAGQVIDPGKADVGPVEARAYTAFIVEAAGSWFLVSAAHVPLAMEGNVKSGKFHSLGCSLGDAWDRSAKCSVAIPFPLLDLLSEQGVCLYDEGAGLDICAVELGPHYRRLLEVNGATAFPQAHWAQGDSPPSEQYWLLGIPEGSVARVFSNDEVNLMNTRPRMVRVWKTDQPPPNPRGNRWPGFAATVHQKVGLDDIMGMSGGPILGCVCDSTGMAHWRPIAAQSCMYGQVVFGCPLTELTGKLHPTLDAPA